MKQHSSKGIFALALSTSLLAISAPAFAQKNDEIVVTAQKREQNLQDVAASVTAFDLLALENNRIEGLEDIGKFTPGVYITNNPADPNGVRVNIRGVGTFDPQIGQDSRVAVYQDGVYLGRTQGLAFDMPDVERVEILKGPQGTLYGRNTVAGAINLVSARPDTADITGKIRAELGKYGHTRINGAVNLPVSENIAVRVSALASDRDGWVENDGGGTDFGGEKKFAVRGALGIDASDRIRVDLAVDFNDVKKEPVFYQSITDHGAGFLAAAVGTAPSNTRQDSVTTSFAPAEGDLKTKGVSLTATYDINDTDELKINGAYREMDSRRFVTLVPTANPQTLNAISSGFNMALQPLPFAFQTAGRALRADWASQFQVPDTTNTGLFLSPPGGAASIEDHRQWSIEAIYNGSFSDGKIDYTSGVFYYDEQTGTGSEQASLTDINSYLFVLGQFDPRILAPNINTFLDGVDVAPQFPGIQPLPPANRGPIPVAGVLLGQIGGGNVAAFPFLQQIIATKPPCGPEDVPGPSNNFCIATIEDALAGARQSAANQLSIDTKAFGIYGQATYHVSDALRLTGGLRWSKEDKDGVGQAISPFFLDNIDLLGNVIPQNIGEYSDDIVNWLARVEYDASDNLMLYAGASTAYRAGGFNMAAVGTRVPETTAGPDFNFGRENITAFEGGFKADFANNRFRLNGAGFYYDFKDQQTTVALNPLIATSRAIVNTDETVWGIEIDGLFALTENLSARASYSWIDGNAGDVTNPLTMVMEVRDELQGTPKNSYLVGLDFNAPVADNMDLFATATYSHKDDILSIPQNALRLTDQDIVNAQIGIDFQFPNGTDVSLSFWGENIFDDEYTIDSLPFETFAYRTIVWGHPATYGVTLGIGF